MTAKKACHWCGDTLMREHEPALARIRPPAPRRHFATRRTLLAAGAACAAGAAAGRAASGPSRLHQVRRLSRLRC
jgi:hypothetical protein